MTDTNDGNPDSLAQPELSMEEQMAAAMAEEMAKEQAQAQGAAQDPMEAAMAEAMANEQNAQAYQPDDLASMAPETVVAPSGDLNLNAILDIPVKVTVEIGRTQVPIRELMRYNPGSVVELARLVGEPLDVLVNGTLVAKGEVVVVNEKFGIRLTDVVNPSERLKQLK